MTRPDYIAIWLLEDFILGMGVDYGTKGSLKYWKVVKRYDDGDVIVCRGNERALLFKDELSAGEKHHKPDFSYPTGIHFGIKQVGYLPWWKRRLSEHTGVR